MMLEWSARGVNGVGMVCQGCEWCCNGLPGCVNDVGMVYQGCEWCWNGLPEVVNGIRMNGVGIVY